MDYNKILLIFRKKIMDEIVYGRGEKREAFIEAMQILMDLEVDAMWKDDGQEGQDGLRAG